MEIYFDGDKLTDIPEVNDVLPPYKEMRCSTPEENELYQQMIDRLSIDTGINIFES